MNKDQLIALLTGIAKVAGSVLAAHGLTQDAAIINTPGTIETVAGIILTILSFIAAHKYNAATPLPANGNDIAKAAGPTPGNTFKPAGQGDLTKLILVFIGLSVGMIGCTAARGQEIPVTLSSSLQGVWDSTLGSSNMVYSPWFARKLTGNADEAGLLGLYNFNQNVAGGIGAAHLWQPSGGQASSTFTLSVGLQLKSDFYPFKMFGETNFHGTVFGLTAVGTPVNGDNHGDLMNANRVGIAFQIHEWKLKKNIVTVGAGAFYGNQTGTGYYDGNYAGGFGYTGWSSADGSPLKAARLDEYEDGGEMAAATVNLSF